MWSSAHALGRYPHHTLVWNFLNHFRQMTCEVVHIELKGCERSEHIKSFLIQFFMVDVQFMQSEVIVSLRNTREKPLELLQRCTKRFETWTVVQGSAAPTAPLILVWLDWKMRTKYIFKAYAKAGFMTALRATCTLVWIIDFLVS